MKKLFSLFFMFAVIVSTANSQEITFANINYHQSVFSDQGLSTLYDSPFVISGEYGMLQDFYGYKGSLWIATDNAREGSLNSTFTQVGVSADLIITLPTGNGSTVIRPFGAVGLVYQNSKIDLKSSGSVMDEVENNGLGYSISGGGLLFLGKYGLNAQYRYVNTESGELQVGWSGLLFGVTFRI